MVRQHVPRAMERGRHRHWPAALGAGVVAAIALPLPGSAQSIADVQRELTEMRRHYDAELKRLQRDYDARIRRLEAQLKLAEKKPVPATASSATAPAEPARTQARTLPASAPEVTVSEAAPATSARPPGITIGTPPRSAPFRLGVKFGWGDSMPGVISDRAIHYREQAERFHRLANMEIQPRTRARLLEL